MIIYSENTIFPFDPKRDSDLFEQYSAICLLISALPTASSVELEQGKQYKVTIERIDFDHINPGETYEV